ncbi:hypothetical protein Droror1_Dr00019905 [Drosera rotundifolia]
MASSPHRGSSRLWVTHEKRSTWELPPLREFPSLLIPPPRFPFSAQAFSASLLLNHAFCLHTFSPHLFLLLWPCSRPFSRGVLLCAALATSRELGVAGMNVEWRWFLASGWWLGWWW